MPLDQNTFDSLLQEVRTGKALRGCMLRQGVEPKDFYRFLDANPGLAQRYAHARVESLDAIAEEAMGIADDPDLDANKARVMVDTRKWLLSKLAPKKYGDHLELTVGTRPDAMAMTRDELLSLAVSKAVTLPALEVKAEETVVQDSDAP